MRKLRFYLCTLILMLCFQHANAQSTFATVNINRSTVYPQQPIKATIRVYTSTWFSSPLAFDNLQIPNAFVISFKRTVSSMTEIDRKKYATLEFFYLIYPYQSGDYTIPSIAIDVETPEEGGYKGVLRTIKTKPVNFSVKEIPESYKETWFVAKGVSFTEKWNKPLDQLKIGDVVERTVTVNAKGTLPSFIPELDIQTPEWASVYPKAATLTDLRNDSDVNGRKVQKILYLLEKEGTFKVPSLKITWWNPYMSKAFFKETPPQKMVVRENPNLGMLESLRDSLSTDEETIAMAEEEEEFLILGMKPWQFFTLLLVVIFILRELFNIGKKLYLNIKSKREAYLNSEKYYFDQLKKKDEFWLQRVYQWWDRFQKKSSPSIEESHSLDEESEKDWEHLLQSKYGGKTQSYDPQKIKKSLGEFRKRKPKESKSLSHQFKFDG